MGERPGLDEALARIEELNRAMGRDPATDPVLSAHRLPEEAGPPLRDDVPEPVASAARDLIGYMDKRIAEITEARAEAKGMLDLLRSLGGRGQGSPPDGDDPVSPMVLESQVARARAEDAAYVEHGDALRAKVARLRDDPLSMFLPLGTVVRFADDPSYPDSLSVGRRSMGGGYPVAGSVGVVTRLNHDAEFPMAVSLRREFTTRSGDRFAPDYERFATYFVDPAGIEVVGPGLLPDGTPCESYGFVPTHERLDDEDEEGPEMVLLADGHHWRFHDFGGKQAIEALQAFDRMDEMPWVGDPVEAYVAPAGPGM